MLPAVLHFAQLGLKVFPQHGIGADGSCTCGNRNCAHPGKHPLASCAPAGLKNATADPTLLRYWWSHAQDAAGPHANIGVATGAASGVFVLDVDGREGEAALRELAARHGALPPTLSSTTGRARHLWYRHPGTAVPSRVGLRPGLDVRGEGACVTAPPSLHASGKRYAWTEPLLEPADPPEWLLRLISSTPGQADSHDHHRSPATRNGEPADDAPVGPADAEHALERAVRLMAEAGEGSRNSTANRMGFMLGRYVGAGLLPEDNVREALLEAASCAGLEPKEAAKAIESGLRAGRMHPRAVHQRQAKPGLRPYWDEEASDRDSALAEQRRFIGGWVERNARLAGIRYEIRERQKEAVLLDGQLEAAGNLIELLKAPLQPSPADPEAAVRRAEREVLAEHGLEALPSRGERHLVTGAQGTGKSRAVAGAVAGLLDPRLSIRWFVPTLEKAEEQAREYRDLAGPESPQALVVRGRSAPDPSKRGEAMCPRHEVVDRAGALGVNVERDICSSCPLKETCGEAAPPISGEMSDAEIRRALDAAGAKEGRMLRGLFRQLRREWGDDRVMG